MSIAFVVVSFSIMKDWENILNGTVGEKLEAFIGFFILLLVSLLLASLKLKTRIDEKGIQHQYYPFHFLYKIIKWNEFFKCYLRKYDTIAEYGGWGLKLNFGQKREKSYTTNRNIGLQLELSNGKKILIDTQKKEEIQRTLNTYKNKIATYEN